jgi:hypothetical protein
MNKTDKSQWWAKIRRGLFVDPKAKHYKKMGSAIWLYGYLHQRAHSDGDGTVQFKYETASRDTGVQVRTLKRMMKTLKNGYVSVKRNPKSLTVKIINFKLPKYQKRELKGDIYKGDNIVLSEDEREDRCVLSEVTDVSHHPPPSDFVSPQNERKKVGREDNNVLSHQNPSYQKAPPSQPGKETGFSFKQRQHRLRGAYELPN